MTTENNRASMAIIPTLPTDELIAAAIAKMEFNPGEEYARRLYAAFVEVATAPRPEPVNARLLALLDELHSMVWDECPTLLDEDSGWNSGLDLEITEAITAAKQQKAQPLPELSEEQLFDIADKHYMPSEQCDSGLFFDRIAFARDVIAADRELRGVK